MSNREHEVGERVIVAIAKINGTVEWPAGYIDRFVADRVRVKLDDGRILPAVHPDACWSVQ